MNHNQPKAHRVTDNAIQRKTRERTSRPQFTSNFTQDNKLFYRFLEDIKKQK